MLNEIRAYMDSAKEKMGDIFDHFTLTIWVTGRSGPNGQGEETDYDVVVEPQHNVPAEKVLSLILQDGVWRVPPCFRAKRFCMYRNNEFCPDTAFAEAKKCGRDIYYALRKEYPIKRQLNWPR